MKGFANLKIGRKLVISYILICLMFSAMGTYAILNMQAMDQNDTELFKHAAVPISEIGEISTEFQRVRVNCRDMIVAQTPEEIQDFVDRIQDRRENINKITESLEATTTSNEKEAFDGYITARDAFRKETDKVIALAQENRDGEANLLLAEEGAAGIASRAYQDAIAAFMTMKLEDAQAKSDENTGIFKSTAILMTVLIAAVFLLSILVGLFISRSITKPLKRASFMIQEMSVGHFGERLNLKTKDEIGQMGGYMDFFADELQAKVIGVMNMVSHGDVSAEIEIKDERDEIAPALKKTVGTIRELNSEVQKLIQAAMEGKLDRRGDSTGYDGAWKDMIDGINGLIDAFVGPINMTAEYVDRISKGDIPPVITDTYQGDFNEIKNNLNGCINVMNGLLAETNLLIEAVGEGKLDRRGDSAGYDGAWKDMIEGINGLVDAFVGPINMTAEYVDRISKGDIPPAITDTYYGDFNAIKNNLNSCIDVMNGLLLETSKLIKAAREGTLDVRADAVQFTGDWGTLVSGVNDLVEAFVKPINVTAEYVDRISKGDIPSKITDTYHGDFNEIKNNLNNCIDIMNGLLTETNLLINAAKEGQLDTRADASGFSGGWGELVGGVNQLVEAVVKPTKEVIFVMNTVSEGRLDALVKGEYKGDFKVLSDAVNSTVNSLKQVVGEISDVIGEIAEGNLSRSHVQVFDGDFVRISESLNTILESLNTVLGDINNSSDQVSIGSKQVSDGSQALSQGATEQASAVEELTASVSEVAAKTKENAANAGTANELTQAVKDNAEKGNHHMAEMLQAMNEINESSNNISRIIKVIDDIAFQTNILALNAAVEAARAGQHGKGFAVVAEEVRTLAARSAEAAKNTTELIQGSIKKSAAGTDIANSTAKALDEIVGGIAKTVDIIAEIAKSSNEQAMGISQINTGLNQVSQVVQTNAATAEESAASSEELSGQAEILKDMVGRFKLRKFPALGAGDVRLLGGGKTGTDHMPKIDLGDDRFDKY